MAKVVKSGLVAKYGSKLDTAVQKHAEDETTFGRIQLPPGIVNGIAQLVECKFDVYKTGKNEGEYYFRAAGVIHEPKEVMTPNGMVTVRGQQTSIMHPVCDTETSRGTTTQEDHVADILNEMRKLGAQTGGCGAAQLEELAATLKEAKPCFRFSTSVRKAMTKDQTDGVWENWHGTKGVEDYVPDYESEFVDEQVTETEEEPEVVEEPTPKPKTKPATAKQPPSPPKKAPPKAPEPEPEDEPFNEFGDLESLIEEAGNEKKGQGARDKLTEWAVQLGATAEEVENASSWEEVGEMITNAQGNTAEEEEAPEPEEEAKEPEPEEVEEEQSFDKGDVVLYKPVDPKTKRPVKKAVECTVLLSDKKKKTATLKNMDDGRTQYKNVSFDELTIGN